MFTRKEIIFLRFPSWNTEIAVHITLYALFLYLKGISFPLTCRGRTLNNIRQIISSRAVRPFSWLLFCLSFCFFEKGFPNRKKTKKSTGCIKAKETENYPCQHHLSQSAAVVILQTAVPHLSSWHFLPAPLCLCIGKPFHKRLWGKRRIQEEKKKTFQSRSSLWTLILHTDFCWDSGRCSCCTGWHCHLGQIKPATYHSNWHKANYIQFSTFFSLAFS